MISKQKLNIYNKYKGDIDAWSRSGSKKEKEVISDDEWFLIDELLQDLQLVEKGLASESFIKDFNSRLNSNCDYETISKLKLMVKTS